MQILINDIKEGFKTILAITILLLIVQLIFHTICPVAILFGIPCPGCGLTRALFSLITFHFKEAANYNLTIYLWVPFAIYLMIMRYIVQKKPAATTAITIVVSLLTIAYYIYRLINHTLVSVAAPGLFRGLVTFIMEIFNSIFDTNPHF